MLPPVEIAAEELREEAAQARRVLLASGLARRVRELAPGSWGLSRAGIELLDALERALAAAREVAKRAGAALDGSAGEPSAPRRAVALAATAAACGVGRRAIEPLADGLGRAERAFDLAAVAELLDGPAEQLPQRLAADLAGFVDHHRARLEHDRGGTALAACVAAWLVLIERAVTELARDVAAAPLLARLARTPLRLEGIELAGCRWREAGARGDDSGLLPVGVDDIVGNEEFLQACLRTARAVAGFDLEAGRNPKTFNPILFALGRPGCGKTVTAHAAARYFLDHCAARDVPASFVVVRRTDWASSYQNASAEALVRLFRTRVAEAPGVVGIYWPDLDTAFAAREDPGIRAEERNILGAVFGLFDGTILPRDGRWFLIADANNLRLDEAVVSRISQDPYLLEGARTPAQVVRLLRDVKLRRHHGWLALDEAAWLEVGTRCRAHDLSGRAVDTIARQAIARIEDFELPDEYFHAPFARRQELVRELSRPLDLPALIELVERYAAFARAAEERQRAESFQRRVDEMVLSVRARREALMRVLEPIQVPGPSFRPSADADTMPDGGGAEGRKIEQVPGPSFRPSADADTVPDGGGAEGGKDGPGTK